MDLFNSKIESLLERIEKKKEKINLNKFFLKKQKQNLILFIEVLIEFGKKFIDFNFKNDLVKIEENCLEDLILIKDKLSQFESEICEEILDLTNKLLNLIKTKLKESDIFFIENSEILKENSLINSNISQEKSKRKIFTESLENSKNMENLLDFLEKSNEICQENSNLKKKFFDLVVKLKLNLSTNNSARNYSTELLFKECIKRKIPQTQWKNFVLEQFKSF